MLPFSWGVWKTNTVQLCGILSCLLLSAICAQVEFVWLLPLRRSLRFSHPSFQDRLPQSLFWLASARACCFEMDVFSSRVRGHTYDRNTFIACTCRKCQQEEPCQPCAPGSKGVPDSSSKDTAQWPGLDQAISESVTLQREKVLLEQSKELNWYRLERFSNFLTNLTRRWTGQTGIGSGDHDNNNVHDISTNGTTCPSLTVPIIPMIKGAGAWTRPAENLDEPEPDPPPAPSPGEYAGDDEDDEEEEELPEEEEEEETEDDEEDHPCSGSCSFCHRGHVCCIPLDTHGWHTWTPWARSLGELSGVPGRNLFHVCNDCMTDERWMQCRYLCVWCQKGVRYLATGRPSRPHWCCLGEGHDDHRWPYHFCNICRWDPRGMIDASYAEDDQEGDNNDGHDQGNGTGRPGSSTDNRAAEQHDQQENHPTQTPGYRERSRSRSRSPNFIHGNRQGDEDSIAPTEEFEPDTVKISLKVLAQLATKQPAKLQEGTTDHHGPISPTEPWSADRRWKRPADDAFVGSLKK